ncbi:uncharacterized protein LOC126669878 isoform X1 [Mercurialis annua]|uniref:uncharacterized protein LOC126669878 isoform X1 n=1 Tax=Mercurialis annua TaxID=3986 RepID=UPI00215EBF1D|nr:uncharacterized protein LOC126669878 isoform X1 [Mercurialis annua]
MEEKMNSSSTKASALETSRSPSVSILQAFSVHLICALGLAIALWAVAYNIYSINLVSDPSHTLFLIWVVETPIVILLYSWFRLNPEQCSYLKAAARGVVAIPVGALVNALGAIVLGAPVGIQYLPKTINWSLLMSSFTFVPAACVFGSSWSHWQRIFAHTKPIGSLEYMICIPAHGAIIAAWFGAWPMPLDWERPWQEWPICVTYGAMTGYLVGMLVSLCFTLARGGRHHLKGD